MNIMIEQKKPQVDLAGKRPLQHGAEDGQGDQEGAQVDCIIITITTIITHKLIIIITMMEIFLKTTRQLHYVIWKNAYISSG